MNKSRLKAPLTRPIFTEAVQDRTPSKAPTQSAREIMATELSRIDAMPKVRECGTLGLGRQNGSGGLGIVFS